MRDAAEEPQEITVHGKSAVIVVSRERYRDLTGEKPTFVDFLRGSPLVGADLSLDRIKSKTRRQVI